MKIRKCPFCDMESPGGIHIYRCTLRNKALSHDQIKYEYLIHNFPLATKENLYEDYIISLLALPALQTKYSLDYKSIQWLLNYYKIEKRTISQACLIGAKRTRKSLFKKYGVINVGQIPEIKRKREKTCIERYGVDNIRKTKEFHIKLEQHIQEKHGISVNELRSKRGKEYWEKLTDEQQYDWLKKSLWSNNGYKSSLETKIEEILKQLNLSYTTQLCIKKKYYDFLINDYNLIIEVNGDYWHASPKKYKATDIIHYPNGFFTAQEIWNKDLYKQQNAKEKGYTIIYIWETEIKESSNLIKLILDKIHEHLQN